MNVVIEAVVVITAIYGLVALFMQGIRNKKCIGCGIKLELLNETAWCPTCWDGFENIKQLAEENTLRSSYQFAYSQKMFEYGQEDKGISVEEGVNVEYLYHGDDRRFLSKN
jgi:hypothetical protein